MSYILLSSSAGGHVFELSQLAPSFQNQKIIHMSEMSGAKNSLGEINYNVPYDNGKNRLRSYLLVLLGFLSALYICLRFRPKLHISLGSHVSIGPTIASWLTRVQTIHIESYTRVNSLSKSGKVILYFADQFYSQWPQLTSIHPKIKYAGSLF